MTDSAYSETALDHAARPRNLGAPGSYDGHARVTGPCGDTMEFWLSVDGDSVAAISFTTDGCGSSLACGSMATCLAEGRSLEQAMCLRQRDILDALGGFPEESEHCALLASTTVRAAIEDYRRSAASGDGPSDGPVTQVGPRPPQPQRLEEALMKIAIPLAGEHLSAHFGHCERFALIDVDPANQRALRREDVAAPPHEPGLLPAWLAERGVDMIIAGGMGQRAQDLFAQRGIEVVVGVAPATPEDIVRNLLAGELRGGANTCDH